MVDPRNQDEPRRLAPRHLTPEAWPHWDTLAGEGADMIEDDVSPDTARWSPSQAYQTIAEANRRSYALHARRYDKTETCLVSPRAQAMLRLDIEKILRMTPSSHRQMRVRALDACGGSGNIALSLLERGASVTVCDISPQMLELFKQRCRERGLFGETHCQEIGSFLSRTDCVFDLIVFSSALHHLEDYTSVLRLAALRLRPGGLIYTVFDPVRWKFPSWQLTWLDFALFKVLNHPEDVLPALRRKIKMAERDAQTGQRTQMSSAVLEEWEVDALAEYHIPRGIDDIALAVAMEDFGLEVVWHERYADARHRPFRLLLQVVRRVTNFKLLLRKPSGRS